MADDDDDDDDPYSDARGGLAAYDSEGLWHVLEGNFGRTAVCGKRLRAFNFAMKQERIGAGERCLSCKWREPPRFLKAMTESEREYLDCVAEVDFAKNGRLRSGHFEDRLERASLEWGWGVDSAANRRTLAIQLIRVAEELDDGPDEIVEARRRLSESRRKRREELKVLNKEVEDDAAALALLEQQLRVAIARGR
jgi:hypothetical protein